MGAQFKLPRGFGQTANPASGTDSADAENCWRGKQSGKSKLKCCIT
jgi:hypothetical protein